MSSLRWISLSRCASFFGCAAILAAGSANAQSTVSNPQSSSPITYSSSQWSSSSSSSSSSNQVAEAALPGNPAALPSAPAPSAAGGGGQYQGSGGVWGYIKHNFAFEGGGGFNAPTSASSPYITWGGNFTIGAGTYITPRLAMLIEYQFIDDKLPGKVIAETGANGGHAHIWSFTLDPYFDIFPKSSNDLYLVGGGGFYRKVTSFTNPSLGQYCTYFYCGVTTVNQVVGHFSSNQGGFSAGGGYQHRFGGMYGESKMKLFAEARYLEVLTPSYTNSPNGLGIATLPNNTSLIPVTIGIRW
ncbi:MAG: hypothetical protein ACLGRW_02560 [Acidobacteriota bacterium]